MSALESTISTEQSNLVVLNPHDVLDPPFANSRKARNEEKFNDVRHSIKTNGIIQPVTVRPSKTIEGKYELLAGFGRRDLARELDIALPALIRDVDDRQAFEIHMSENLDREDLSFSDEIRAAQHFVSLYLGDRKAASQRLGWSDTRLRERLELVTCADEVLSALDNNSIRPGHAAILASFEHGIQRNTLELIISEKLTVAELKARAGNVQLPLDKAKFDTAGCQQCPHNSAQQSGLFDVADTGAKCSKPKCYLEKIQVFLSDVVEQQKESHGRVIFMTESAQHERRTVAESIVGERQFNSGCSSCDKRAAIVDDRPSYEGQVTPSQCLDQACFDKCVKTFKTENIKTVKPTEAGVPQAVASAESNATTTSKPEREVAQQVTPKVLDAHKEEIAVFAAQHLKSNQLARLAVMAVALESFVKPSCSPTRRVKELVGMGGEDLQRHITACLDTAFGESETYSSGTNKFDFLSALLGSIDGGNEAAIQAWQPTEKTLSAYYTGGIKGIAEEAGADKSLPSGALSGKKADAIKAVLNVEHDWATYAPNAFIKLLK